MNGSYWQFLSASYWRTFSTKIANIEMDERGDKIIIYEMMW